MGEHDIILIWDYEGWYVWVLTPTLLMLPLLVMYVLALRRGLDCARDDQHRLAPRPPWFFFRMGSRRWLRRLVICLIPSVALLVPLQILIPAWWHANKGMPVGPSEALFWLMSDAYGMGYYESRLTYCIEECVRVLGALGLTLAVVTLLAPRVSSTFALVIVGGLILIALLWISRLGGRIPPPLRHVPLDSFSSIGFAGLATFAVAWFHVRFILNRRWFRLPEG